MITEKEVSKKLRRILDELGVEYSKILLFGSRARSDFDEESDWDFLIILKKSVDLEEKKELWHKIYKKFHEYFPFVSVDIILKDVESFENEKTIVNTVSNEVYLEGVEI
ncbi:MAG: nucleotidyltransferase family protein [Asgard group archaeon]